MPTAPASSYTYTDGDEPGVGMNLYRFLDGMGYRPVLMGQMKGILDRYRTPETQSGFAEKHGQNPAMLASFADGSKLALEAAIMGNATGFVPQVRGMQGYACDARQRTCVAVHPGRFREGGLRRLLARRGAAHRRVRDLPNDHRREAH